MRKIYYIEKIHKLGWFGSPYIALTLRTAHVDQRHYDRLKGRRFTVRALLEYPALSQAS